MTPRDRELLTQIRASLDAAAGGALADAADLLTTAGQTDDPLIAGLRASATALVAACTKAFSGKEDAIGRLQLTMLEAEDARDALSAEVEERKRTEAKLEAASVQALVARDELSASEAFLREVFATMPGALFVVNRHGVIEATNEAATELLHYRSDELLGQPLAMVFDAGEAPAVSSDGRPSFGDALHAEKRCLGKEGTVIPVLVWAAVRSTPKGEPSGMVCVVLDIRDRKELEVELRQAQKLESIGRLAAGVAHEINTPVQFVSDSVHFIRDAFAEVMALMATYESLLAARVDQIANARSIAEEVRTAREVADADYLLEHVPRALQRSTEGLARIAEIVRSMKEFAHPDRVELTAIDLNLAIRNTLTMARSEYKYVAELETDLGELPPVSCHPSEINQAILNLVINASHAIADAIAGTNSKGKIAVRTRCEWPSVVITISDTGRGVPEHLRERIFEPFFTTKEVGKGTGQGLSIARRAVVERHGGTLTFESTSAGATFCLRLPIDGPGVRASQPSATAAQPSH